MENKIRVQDYMSDFPPYIESGAVLSDVIEQLLKNAVTGLPVVDNNKHLIGFVSEQDCISKLLSSSYYCGPESTVDEVMQSKLSALSPQQSIVDVAQQMLTGRPRLYPVIESQKLVGLFTRGQLLQALKENQALCHEYKH